MAKAMRPASIRWFERLFYCGLAVATLNTFVVMRNLGGSTELDSAMRGVTVVVFVLSTALNLLFLWLIAYRASNIARWIFIALLALGFVSLVVDFRDLRQFGDLSLALTLAQYLLCVVEIWLLVRPDAQRWFAGVRDVDPDVFS